MAKKHAQIANDRDVHIAVNRWYRQYGRLDLPWRVTTDAYAIYVSEVMLQQTQVKTVLERYYFPFLEAFPTLQALADAPLEAVLKQWEGLGYYSRARNLHRAAQLAAPTLPDTVEGLMALPGIGRNTAHAIAAFAHHQPVPVLEANVKRVLCRFFAEKDKESLHLWESAACLVDPENPFDYNQAMMDIGALICTPKAPKCDQCPLALHCQGREAPEAYPEKKRKKPVPVRIIQIWLLQNAAGQYWMTKRDGAFLHGLYRFWEEGAELPPPAYTKKIGSIIHTYSHFRLEAAVYLMLVEQADIPSDALAEGGWYSLDKIRTLPLSRAEHKALALL